MTAREALGSHWPEYLIEGWALGTFMIAAGVVATVLGSPASPVGMAITDPMLRNVVGASLWASQHEFLPEPAHQCMGWPLALPDLEPYYLEAEKLLGVRLFEREPDLARILGRFALPGSEWQAQAIPLALAADITSHRAEAAHFDGFASVEQLKGEADGSILSLLKTRPNFTLVVNAEYASSGPQRLPNWNPSAGGIEAFYFRDPDGHNLEILAFPPDKGPAKWHVKKGQLFLGIDHTAIVVSDTEASLHFYRDVLGLRVVGASDNYGSEQEHLNNVFGAHLRITTLRAAQGPGVEFLEYLAPRTGRSIPADTQADDLWYWQINMRVAAAESVVSAGTTPLHDGALGWGAGVIAHDPDGHASLIARDRNVTPK